MHPLKEAFEEWHSTFYVQDLERYADTYKNSKTRARWEGFLGAFDVMYDMETGSKAANAALVEVTMEEL
jgi:hypothetical protein